MAVNGVKTTDLVTVPSTDALLGNHQGSTVQISAANVAAQIRSDPAFSKLPSGAFFNTYAQMVADVSLNYSSVQVGDHIFIDSGMLFTIADASATDQHATTQGGLKVYESGVKFTTRSRFEEAVTRGESQPDGIIVDAGGEMYVSQAGDTSLVSLPGYRQWTGGIQTPYVIVITGQSNAAGARNGGPNPASPLVKTWDGSTAAWGGSDYTTAPWSLSNPDGNSGNNNYALARAHRIADDTGRQVYVIFDAMGGTSITEWVGSGTASTRYAAIKTKVEAALTTTELSGVTEVDEIIWAQGEEDALTTDFTAHLANLTTLFKQFRGEAWCADETPAYLMGPSGLHTRYQWTNAFRFFASKVDNREIYVPSGGLDTDFTSTGAGDNTHFLGASLWQAGYYRIADAAPVEIPPELHYGRGNGPALPSDTTVLTTYSSMVSYDSWTVGSAAPNGPAATGSISWGYQCVADGNYSYAFGYQCVTDNTSNYGLVAGRAVTTGAACDYFLAGGYQINMDAKYTFGAGRGHSVVDPGGAALGVYSEYTSAEIDNVILQVGIGTTASASNRKNGLTVRKSGSVEMKNLSVYADNAAAVAGGMGAGTIYRTATGELRIVV